LLASAFCAAADPSFDCARASTADEKAICADPILARIDTLATQAYRSYEADFQPKGSVARAFLKDRAGCGGDVACIAGVQSRALETFFSESGRKYGPPAWVASYAEALMGAKASALAERTGGPPHGGVPERPGECAGTRIAEVTTRFGNPVGYSNEDEGTAITFENGGYQVSYSRDGLQEAKAGDRVVVCMMSVLHDCPNGDDRGNLFYTLDLETNGQWTLTDTQHMCGGA